MTLTYTWDEASGHLHVEGELMLVVLGRMQLLHLANDMVENVMFLNPLTLSNGEAKVHLVRNIVVVKIVL